MPEEPFNPFGAFGDPFASRGNASDFESDFSPFSDLYEEFPDIAIRGAFERSNPTPNQRRNFSQQRDNVMALFNTEVDRQIRAGESPDARIGDIADRFDFRGNFDRFSPQAAFSPRTQVFSR